MPLFDYSDCYKILNIPEDSSFDIVKKAYRRCVHLYHPDVCSKTPENIKKFKQIQLAYQKLREISLNTQFVPDETKKRQPFSYDKFARIKLNLQKEKLKTANKNQKNLFFKRANLASEKYQIEVDIISRNLPTKALIDRLTASYNKFVRMSAAKALLPRKSPKNLLYLLSACNDKDLEVRDYVIQILRSYFDYEGLSCLKKIWEMSSFAQRFKLLLIFEKINDPRVTSVITQDNNSSKFLSNKLRRFLKKYGKLHFSIFE